VLRSVVTAVARDGRFSTAGRLRSQDGSKGYRVRARHARSRATPDNHPAALYKLEAVEPHTIVIIARLSGGVMY
jgi:hypothetical protein